MQIQSARREVLWVFLNNFGGLLGAGTRAVLTLSTKRSRIKTELNNQGGTYEALKILEDPLLFTFSSQ